MCSKKKGGSLEQTDPPSIPVADLFPDGEFPLGEFQDYKDDNLWRKTSAEKREQERLEKPLYENVRQAAEVHRQVRPLAEGGGAPSSRVQALEATSHKLWPILRGMRGETGSCITQHGGLGTPWLLG